MCDFHVAASERDENVTASTVSETELEVKSSEIEITSANGKSFSEDPGNQIVIEKGDHSASCEFKANSVENEASPSQAMNVSGVTTGSSGEQGNG